MLICELLALFGISSCVNKNFFKKISDIVSEIPGMGPGVIEIQHDHPFMPYRISVAESTEKNCPVAFLRQVSRFYKQSGRTERLCAVMI